MRSVIIGFIALTTLITLTVFYMYIFSIQSGTHVEMTSNITSKTLEKGLYLTLYSMPNCNRSYYILEIQPLLNQTSLLILNICFKDDCKTYEKTLRTSESLTLNSPIISANESLNISISGSLVSPPDGEKIEDGRVKLKFIGICCSA